VPLPPNSTLATIWWLKTVDGLPVDQIGTTLPKTRDGHVNLDLWVEHGFIQVNPTGGAPMTDIPVGEPVMGITCWAAHPNSKKPQWGRANGLASLVIQATYEHRYLGRVALPDPYYDVRVFSAYPTTEPVPVEHDEAHAVAFRFDLAVRWVVAP